MSEYIVDSWTLCTKDGHPKGGKWTRGKDCPDHPHVEGGPAMTVVKVDYENGVITVDAAPPKRR